MMTHFNICKRLRYQIHGLLALNSDDGRRGTFTAEVEDA